MILIKTISYILSFYFLLFNYHSVDSKETLKVGITAIPPMNFNPFRNTGLPYVYTWSAVFDGLTSIDNFGNVQPSLAKSWKNVNKLTWQFHLREDVYFSNGKKFNSDSIVYAINYLISEAASRELVSGMMFFLESARSIDDYTVEITTVKPSPMLPRFMPMLYALEPNHWSNVGLQKFSQEPVATGPFVVKEIKPTKIIFSKFYGSWREPKIDNLEIIAMPDMSSRAIGVLSGQLDIAMQLGPDETKMIENNGGKAITWTDPEIWAYHLIQKNNPALSDVRVRQALNIAIDRDAIINNLLENSTKPATQPAPPRVYGFNKSLPPIPYDPDKARRLLTDAGYPEGFELTIEATSGSSANDSAVVLTVAQYLRNISVNMNIKTVTVPQLIQNAVEGKWGADGYALHYSYPPTSDILRSLDMHSCLRKTATYCNREIMPAINAAHREFDPVKSLKLRNEIMEFYRKDWASIFMYQAPRYTGTSKNVSGLKIINNIISYDKIQIKSE